MVGELEGFAGQVQNLNLVVGAVARKSQLEHLAHGRVQLLHDLLEMAQLVGVEVGLDVGADELDQHGQPGQDGGFVLGGQALVDRLGEAVERPGVLLHDERKQDLL